MWHTTPIGVFQERLIGYVLQTKSYKQKKGRLKTSVASFAKNLIRFQTTFGFKMPDLIFFVFRNILRNGGFRVTSLNNLGHFLITTFFQVAFTQLITLHAKYDSNT